jgi:arsenate reductase
MQQVLVVCTGNSCRSILAESLINQLGAARYQAHSAGSFPSGSVHPGALATLARHNIASTGARSKSWDEFVGKPLDIVITVCDQAAGETCPAFGGQYQRLHWSTPDPASATGNEEDIKSAFELAYKMLKERIESELL